MAGSKRKRKQDKRRSPHGDRTAALRRAAMQARGKDLAPGTSPAGWHAEPVGYTAPDEPELEGMPPALAGYGSDDQIPVVIQPDPDAPPPRNAGAYIGQANTTITMVDQETGREIPAPPGSRLYLRTSGPEPGIDTTVRVGDLTRMDKIPARVIVEVPEGDTLGVRPGDVVAARQPVGYTDRAGSPVIYADTLIELPDSEGNPPGSRVWRAQHPDPGSVIRGEDVRFPALREEYTLGYREQDAEPPVIDIGRPRPLGESRTAVGGDVAAPVQHHGEPRRKKPGTQVPVVPPGLRKPAGQDELLRRLEVTAPGLAARLAQGLSKDELAALGPEIAQAMEASGADPGTFAFSAGGDGKPQLIVTDDLDSVPGGADDEDTYVIEDLDAEDSDAGRLLMGSRSQVTEYHRRTEKADQRARKLLPAMADESRLVRSYDAATAIRVRKNWTADEVLDTHAWLTRAYRHPPDDLADYLAFHIRQAVSDDHHTQSLFWPVDLSAGADIPQGRQMAQLIARGLDDSRTLQVTAPMCHKLRDDWNSRPGELLILDEGILPVPAGFAWLDAPWLAEKLSEGIWLPVRAVSWERTIATVSSERGQPYAPPGVSTVDAVRVVLWLLIADDVAFGRWKGAEKRADKVANKVGRLVPQQIALLPFGIRVDTGRRVSTNGKELMGLIHTLWTTLGEKLPKSREVRASHPAVRARVQRSIKHGTVHIIPLREYEFVGEPNGHFPAKRDWRGRWWVEEFYRHIDAYDDGTDEKGRRRRHQAVPAKRWGTVTDDDHDICAVCLANGQTVRIALVHTFAKGPTDKPFITPGARKRTVWKLKR
jgi:hypothetical protein